MSSCISSSILPSRNSLVKIRVQPLLRPFLLLLQIGGSRPAIITLSPSPRLLPPFVPFSVPSNLFDYMYLTFQLSCNGPTGCESLDSTLHVIGQGSSSVPRHPRQADGLLGCWAGPLPCRTQPPARLNPLKPPAHQSTSPLFRACPGLATGGRWCVLRTENSVLPAVPGTLFQGCLEALAHRPRWRLLSTLIGQAKPFGALCEAIGQ